MTPSRKKNILPEENILKTKITHKSFCIVKLCIKKKRDKSVLYYVDYVSG